MLSKLVVVTLVETFTLRVKIIFLERTIVACILQEHASKALYNLMLTILAIFILVLEGSCYQNANSSFSAHSIALFCKIICNTDHLCICWLEIHPAS